MKKILTVAIVALLVWSCGSKTHFTINGEVIPSTDGSMVLFGFENGNPVPIDTAEIKAGKFMFEGDVEVPELNLMSIDGQNQYVAQLFIEPGKLQMTIYPDSFEANMVVGSKTQDVFQIYMEEMIKFSKGENDLKRRYSQAQMSGDEEEMGNVRFEYETMIDNTQLYSRNFISEYSSSPVAAYVYLMNFFQEAQLEELDSMLTVFEPIQNSEFVTAIKERAESLRASGKGAIAPDFTLMDPDGNEIALSSLRGKIVLIDFWASWCQPCMLEMPNVIAQYATYKDKGFEIFGVSLDRDREAWLSTIKAKEMTWLHGWDMENSDNPGAVANLYGVTGIPHTVLLDKEGKIIEMNLRGPALQEKLAELLD